MKLLGADVKDCGDGGGISVQGDTTIHNTGLRTCGAALIVIASLLAGGAGTALYAYLNRPTAAVSEVKQPAQANWRLGLRVSDTP